MTSQVVNDWEVGKTVQGKALQEKSPTVFDIDVEKQFIIFPDHEESP